MHQPPLNNPDVRVAVDTVAAAGIIGTLIGYLPALAAFAAIVWYAIQVWESKTVQRHVRAWRIARRRKLMARKVRKAAAVIAAAPPAVVAEVAATGAAAASVGGLSDGRPQGN